MLNERRTALMATNIFAGKLSYDTTNSTLKEVFGKYGEVASAKVIFDRETDRSKGFAFVEMTDLKEAQAAIKELDGTTLDGRTIAVNAAREREERPRQQSGGFRRSW